MNPSGVYLKGKYDAETELNFYTFGIAKLLNCKCKKECICENGIKLRKESGMFIFIFPQDVGINQIENIAEKIGERSCQTIVENLQFKCGKLNASITPFGKNTVTFEIW